MEESHQSIDESCNTGDAADSNVHEALLSNLKGELLSLPLPPFSDLTLRPLEAQARPMILFSVFSLAH